jgi:hypothetical protein
MSLSFRAGWKDSKVGVLGTIIVAFFSGLVGAGSSLELQSINRIAESRSTAAILAAEIAATLSIIKQRRYVEDTKSRIERLNKGQNPELSDFVHNNTETLDVAYRASVTGFKVGLVGRQPK